VEGFGMPAQIQLRSGARPQPFLYCPFSTPKSVGKRLAKSYETFNQVTWIDLKKTSSTCDIRWEKSTSASDSLSIEFLEIKISQILITSSPGLRKADDSAGFKGL
jgi:hypothetical protein